MFKKNKGAQSPQDTAARKERAAISVMQAAQMFDQSLAEEMDKSRTLAWRITGIFAVITVMAVGAVLGLTPLKETLPFLVRVDNNTGVTDTVSVLKDQQDSYGEVMDRYWLARYVIARESYDWETIGGTAKETKLLSADKVASEYTTHMNLPSSALNVLKDQMKIVTKVNAISFLDQGKSNIAQIRFTTLTVPVNGELSAIPVVAHYIATVAYEYRNQPTQEADRLLNPLGFKALSYQADPETVK